MKLNNLFQHDFKIVENKKKVFIPPIAIVALAIIMCLIFYFVSGDAFNVGMDFTGGYSISVQLGNKMTDDTYEEYKELAVDIAEDLKDDEGNPYGIKISSVQRQGNADTAGLLLKYKAVGTEEEMEVVNEKLHDALADSMFFYQPEVAYNDAKTEFTATYDGMLLAGDYAFEFKNKLASAGFDVKDVVVSEDKKAATVTLNTAPTADVEAKTVEVMTVADTYGGIVADGGQTSSTVSGEILKTTLLAISVGLLLMLVYIVIRFELLSGIAAVAALAHDILMMVCFMGIFHIEINSTFIAALITVLGYSINNTIIIFDRVRENMALYRGKKGANGKLIKPPYIANKSVQDTIWRSINTTITTLITIALVAIIGVDSIRIFALPIIFGLMAGTYSSIFLAPTIWAMLATYFPGSLKAPKTKRNVASSEK